MSWGRYKGPFLRSGQGETRRRQRDRLKPLIPLRSLSLLLLPQLFPFDFRAEKPHRRGKKRYDRWQQGVCKKRRLFCWRSSSRRQVSPEQETLLLRFFSDLPVISGISIDAGFDRFLIQHCVFIAWHDHHGFPFVCAYSSNSPIFVGFMNVYAYCLLVGSTAKLIRKLKAAAKKKSEITRRAFLKLGNQLVDRCHSITRVASWSLKSFRSESRVRKFDYFFFLAFAPLLKFGSSS